MDMVQAECTTLLEGTPTENQRAETFILGGVQEFFEAGSAILLS